MKTKFIVLVFLTCGVVLCGQQPVNVQKSTASSTRNEITGDLEFPAGRDLTLNGTLNGTPSGGSLNLSNVTVTGLPAGSVAWGGITGTLSLQTDLQLALDAKLAVSVLNGYFADPSTNVSFSASAWRTDLGLGTLATQSGTFSGSSSGTNTGDQTITLTGDVSGGGTGSFAATIQPNSVALGTDTTGDYVATVTGDSEISVSGAGTEGRAVTLAVGAAIARDTEITAERDTVATLTNKRITARVTTITSSATPTVNTDNCDAVTITALATAITSMTTNLTGTPANFDRLIYRIKDDGTGRGITWGASFASRGATLPTTTVANKVLAVVFWWNSVTSTWDCMATATEA